MSERFQDKYRIPSARASWWDYGRNAAYFVTICAEGRECYFGNIAEALQTAEILQTVETLHATSLHQKNILSPIGEIAQSCWKEIPEHFPYVQLDSFVVMPNHVHGIIIIDKRIGMMVKNESIESTDNKPTNSIINMTDGPVETRLIASLQHDPNVQYDSTVKHDPTIQPDPIIQHDPTIQNQQSIKPQKLIGGITGENNPMLHDNLSRIVRWYKGRTTFESHKINPNFGWQTRFYENIIRSEQSYRMKSDYIISNPSKWKDDQFYIN
ncbi:MAG TPA: hypothetical protein VFC67_26115 [Prolixibacteraceae bacterium]|nr:hypothetical protein [Prolixibacteraceae bacterium]